MKLIFYFLIVPCIWGCASHFTKNKEKDLPSVYVLGSIHGNMLDQPNNNLNDFVKALYVFKPTLILSEVRPEFPGAVEGSVDGGPEQSIVYAFAKETGSLVVPVDWFDDQYNLLSEKENSQITKEIKKEIDPLFEEFRNVVRNGTFKESQSRKTQELIRARYDILAKNGLTTLRNRDQKICKNIQNQAHLFSSHRVLVVFGLAHKYYLEDCLKEVGIPPLDIQDWFQEIELTVPSTLKKEAIQNFKEAKMLLRQRLKKKYYKTDIENLKVKLNEFDLWIQKTKEL